MARFSILLSLALLNLVSSALAQAVCSSSTYSTLLGLSTYAPAESYCSQYFPQSKVKTTVTVTSTAMTTITTAVKRAVNAKTTTVTTTTTAGPCTGACSTLSSITATQPVAFQSTFCSCIESPPTKTVTKTVTSATTTKIKKTKTTTTTVTVTPSPTNEVLNPGFENGGTYWSFGGCTVDCNYPNSGSCEALCAPQPNTQQSVSQDFATTAGASTLTFALGYVGNSSVTTVPQTTLYINGVEEYSVYVCGNGAGGPATPGCTLDGNAHYIQASVSFTATGTDTDLDFTFLFSDPNAATDTVTMLLDDIDFQLAS